MFPQKPELSKGVDAWRKRKGFSCFYLSINRRKTYYPDADSRNTAYDTEAALRALNISDGSGESVTPRDHFDLAEIRKMAGDRGGDKSLFEIFKMGLEQMPQISVTVKAARDEFVVEKERAVAARAMKKNSFKQQRYAVDTMIREARVTMMADIRNPTFRHWILNRKVTKVGRRIVDPPLPMSAQGLYTYQLALGVFLNWCVEKRYLAKNPLEEIEIPEPPPKRAVFTTAQAKHLLEVAQKKFPDLVPLLAVEWFAGVRPETAEQLDYSAFDRREKAIRLSVGKFDQGEAEHVERIPDTLWQWLPRRKTGRLAPPNYKHRLTLFHAALGYTLARPWPKDVARHTFVSNFAALTGSLERVAYAINHKRPATTLKWYRRRVKKSAAVDYFKQRPRRRVGNV